jgi:hypothetical protein
MKQKNDLSIISSIETSKEIKSQQMFDFGNLPVDDIKSVIGSYLESTTQNSLAMTSLKHFQLFKPNFKSELVIKLLDCIVWGKQNSVEKLLKTSPELMLERTTFTDYSGRTFSNISAFEYVLWALDTRYMVNMMLNCLPNDDKGLAIAKALKGQYEHVDIQGVTYTLEGKTITEKHFDFSVLINALQTYVNQFNNWGLHDRVTHWCTEVGRAQCDVPAHVIQHYCDPEKTLFDASLSLFTKKEELRRTLEFYNLETSKGMTWRHPVVTGNSVLGVNLGLCCMGHKEQEIWWLVSGRHWGALGTKANSAASSHHDLVAITALCKERIEDFNLLKQKIENRCQNLDEPQKSNYCVIL